MPEKTRAAVASGGQKRDLRAAANHPRAHCTANPGNEQVYAQGRIVGQVRGGVFCKAARASIHMLRKPPAWAVDVASLLQAEQLGATAVEIHDSESGCTYTATVAQVRRHGFVLERGHGRQIALALDRWQVWRPGEAVAGQLGLWEVAP